MTKQQTTIRSHCPKQNDDCKRGKCGGKWKPYINTKQTKATARKAKRK